MNIQSKNLKNLLLTILMGASIASANAASFPQKPITLIVPFAPGGGTDSIARDLSKTLSEKLGQSVVVDNRGGGGGSIGASMGSKAAPDGYTLTMISSSHSVNVTLQSKQPYDLLKDIAPITQATSQPYVLVINPALPVKNVADLVKLAKEKPGQLNFAIGALGSSLHLAGDSFKMKAGVFIVNIPYRGTAPAVQDVLAGQVELMFAAVGNAQAHIKAGKLRALGVTSPKRLPAFPDVQAIGETLPGYESSAWFGLFAPGRMNPDLAKRLSDAARVAIQTPDVKRRIEMEGAIPAGNSPQEFSKFVEAEIVRWRAVVQYSGAKPE